MDSLQWGRRSNTAESKIRRIVVVFLLVRFNGAAVRIRRRGLRAQGSSEPICCRFNGAAVRIRRRAYELAIKGFTAYELQWGRRSNTAESSPSNMRNRPTATLQWGRRSNTAERSTQFTGAGGVSSGFNGAAVRIRRRAIWNPISRDDGWPASMGPPFEYGGETPRDGPRAPRSRCFNGAAVRIRRRDVWMVDDLDKSERASMGPPFEYGGEIGAP